MEIFAVVIAVILTLVCAIAGVREWAGGEPRPGIMLLTLSPVVGVIFYFLAAIAIILVIGALVLFFVIWTLVNS
ncbi:hypothetical protein [Arthrobacter sp. K5]|uniref:DUF131 domain-containing protein n=1 Tax=Arthrobacter sp. K5 TaxID=2839623 RepID=A0AAU8ERW0_9MICC